MGKHGKKYLEASQKVEKLEYGLEEAISLIKEIAYAKFDDKDISPLLTTKWDQGWPYNKFCPDDEQGPIRSRSRAPEGDRGPR